LRLQKLKKFSILAVGAIVVLGMTAYGIKRALRDTWEDDNVVGLLAMENSHDNGLKPNVLQKPCRSARSEKWRGNKGRRRKRSVGYATN